MVNSFVMSFNLTITFFPFNVDKSTTFPSSFKIILNPNFVISLAPSCITPLESKHFRSIPVSLSSTSTTSPMSGIFTVNVALTCGNWIATFPAWTAESISLW